jgi:hypothetical protein
MAESQSIEMQNADDNQRGYLDLDRPLVVAQRAGLVLDQPSLDAVHVEHVAALAFLVRTRLCCAVHLAVDARRHEK